MVTNWSNFLQHTKQRKPCSLSVGDFKTPPSGRLSLIFGNMLAEKLRLVFKLSYVHSSAGGEWPHSYGSRDLSTDFESAIEFIDGVSEFHNQKS
jgi:hypothetical protein